MKRSRIAIAVEILKLLAEEDRKIWHIETQCRLNHRLAADVVEKLLKAGMVQKKRKLFFLTQAGRDALQAAGPLEGLL